jgi:hypothetical protein
MLLLRLLPLLVNVFILPIVSAQQVPVGPVTYSGLKFAACDPKDPLQKWDVEQPEQGVGEIRDRETGRCVSVLDCKNKQSIPMPYQDVGQVVLDECGTGSCDGKNSKWTAAAAAAAGWVIFESRDISTSSHGR